MIAIDKNGHCCFEMCYERNGKIHDQNTVFVQIRWVQWVGICSRTSEFETIQRRNTTIKQSYNIVHLQFIYATSFRNKDRLDTGYYGLTIYIYKP